MQHPLVGHPPCASHCPERVGHTGTRRQLLLLRWSAPGSRGSLSLRTFLKGKQGCECAFVSPSHGAQTESTTHVSPDCNLKIRRDITQHGSLAFSVAGLAMLVSA